MENGIVAYLVDCKLYLLRTIIIIMSPPGDFSTVKSEKCIFDRRKNNDNKTIIYIINGL